MRNISWRRKDVLAGLVVTLIGIGAIFEALSYNLGTAAQMGPGFFPLSIGMIIVALGLGIIMIGGRGPEMHQEEGDQATTPWRALIALPLSILIFSVATPSFGLAPATFLAVFISTFADRTLTLLRSLVIALGWTTLCILIFRVGLGIQVRVFIW